MRRLTALAGLLLVAAGCSSPPPPPVGRPAVVQTAPSATPPPPNITLAFGGDVHFTGRTAPLLDDPASAFGPIAEVLRAADVAMINLETAVTTRGTAAAKTYTFRAAPAAYDAIKATGIDVVSLANNHGIDYGPVGLSDTLELAQAAGMPLVGAGPDAATAYAPWITDVRGVRLAFLGFTAVNTFNDLWPATDTRAGLAYAISASELERAVQAVQDARAQADVIVVFMHWGQERNPCPTSVQRTIAQRLAEAGAAIIVGAHPHILQGAGWLGGTYVAYSLGNFVWYSNTSDPDTGVLRIYLRGATVTGADFVPASIHPAIGQPIPASGASHDRIMGELEGLRGCTGLSGARPAAV